MSLNKLFLSKFILPILIFTLSVISIPIAQAQSSQEIINQAEKLKWLDIDSALWFLASKLDSANKIDNQLLLADLQIEMSKAYNAKRDCDSIKFWMEKAKPIYKKLNNKRGKAEVNYQEGYWYYCQGKYETALEFILKGLAIMESINDTRGIALGNLRLARIYHFTYKLHNSSKYGSIGGQKFEEVNDLINAADSWSFAGHGFRVLKEIDKASYAFAQSLRLAKETNSTGVLSMAYNDLASFYAETGIYDSAEYYFYKSLEIANPDDERQIMVIRSGLCQSYLAAKQYQKCIDVANLAMITILKTNDSFFLSEVPEYIAKAYEELGQFDSAYKYMKMNWIYSDSLFTKNQEDALENMRVKYETDKKDKQLASQKKNNIFIIAISIILVILLGVLLLYYKKRNEKNKELTQLNIELDKKNQQNELLLKEIHHRVKNNLEMVKSLIALQSAKLDDSATKDAMMASQSRVQTMGIIHQKLYQGDNLGSIEMKDYFVNLSEGILDTFNAEDKVKIACVMDELELDIDTAVPIGLIVNELLTNALKYAFPKDRLGNIKINLSKQNETLQLQVSDNGIGKSEENSPHGTGFGSQLISLLTIQLNGQMEESQEGGMTVSFKFNIAA